ncbi:MAG: tetratricopeptide repeat protein, partial [Chloroflexota bacterium]|nr:tetratricopeptide repeat protein [Chloroflexota bacterium]
MADPPINVTRAHSGGGPLAIGGNVTDNRTQTILPAYSIPSAHEIPAPPDDFVGRAAECSGLIETLIGQAGRGGAVALIHGLGGMGKTALAGRVAYLLRGAFPRQVRLDLAGAGPAAVGAAAALDSAIRALGYDPQLPVPDSSEERQRLYLSLAASQPTLILADNAAGVAQVKPLLPPPGSALLVTSRQRFALPGANGPADVDLAGLPPADAATLLQTICPRIGDQAAALAKLCGCLPLALRISASLLKDPMKSLPRYLQELADIRTRLHALRDPQNPDDPDSNVAASFTLSYAALDPLAQSTLAQLSIFPAPFDEAAATAVVALPPDSAALDEILALLRYRSLLEGQRDQNDTAHYSLHDLVRAFAATHLPAADPATLRYAQHYAAVAEQAERLYLTKGRTAAGLALFDGERLHIDTGWAWARAQADSDAAAALLLAYADATAYIGDLRYHQRSERIPQLEAGLEAARRLGRRDAEGVFLGNLGIAYANLGEVRRAIGLYEQRLEIAREIGDRAGEGAALGNLGIAYANLGEVRRAIGYYEQQLVITREIDDRAGEGNALGNLGIAYAAVGEVRRAIGYYEQHLAVAREIGGRRGEGAALGNLGVAYKNLGEVRRAIGLYEQRLEIAREIGDRAG